jgi:hypothetical protein
VFVPAMFMMMDDIGALFWRFGKRLLVSNAETEHRETGHKPPPAPTVLHPPAAE